MSNGSRGRFCAPLGMRRLAPFATCDPRFLAVELVRGAGPVRSLATALRELAHKLGIHGREPSRTARFGTLFLRNLSWVLRICSKSRIAVVRLACGMFSVANL